MLKCDYSITKIKRLAESENSFDLEAFFKIVWSAHVLIGYLPNILATHHQLRDIFVFNNWHFYSKIHITIGSEQSSIGWPQTWELIEVTHCSWSKLSQCIVMFRSRFVTFHKALLILPRADCIRQVSGSCYRLLSWPYVTPAQEMALCLLFRPVFFFFFIVVHLGSPHSGSKLWIMYGR